MSSNNSISAINAASELKGLEEGLATTTQGPALSDPIPISLINRQSSLGRLIEGSDHELKITDKEYSVRFKEAYFVYFIDFSFKEKTDDLTVSIDELKGTRKLGRPTIIDGTTSRYSVQGVVLGFTLEGKKSFLGRRVVTKVDVRGINLAAIEKGAVAFEQATLSLEAKKSEISKLFSNINTSIQRLTKLEESQTEIEESIEAKTIDLKQLEEDISSLTLQKKSKSDDLQATNAKHQALVNDSNKLANSIAQLEGQQAQLNTSIVQMKEKLAQLTSDKNLFTEEISTFNRQSNAQKRVYSIFSLVPMVMIAALGVALLRESSEVAASGLTWDQALNLFTSHTPKALATIVIVWASYSIARAFIHKVMDLDRQQLSFSKLGIVAREVSKSSAEGLDLSAEKEYEMRILLKMNLLKTYLKEELGKQFDYQRYSSKGWLTPRGQKD